MQSVTSNSVAKLQTSGTAQQTTVAVITNCHSTHGTAQAYRSWQSLQTTVGAESTIS